MKNENQSLFEDKTVTKEEYEKNMLPSNNDLSIDEIGIKADDVPDYFYDCSYLKKYENEDCE